LKFIHGFDVEEYEEIQGRPSQPSRSHERLQNIGNAYSKPTDWIEFFSSQEHNQFAWFVEQNQTLMVHLSLPALCFASEFGDVERCVKVCTGVWIRDFLADFLILRQRPKFQVITVYCDVF
jgi:hypothetical protein